MTPIVLVAINARFIHPPFGLMCIRAALGSLRDRSRIVEFVLKTPLTEMVETIVAEGPRIVGLGVYLWNHTMMTDLARELRTRLPGVKIVAGGPEMEGLAPTNPLPALVDLVIHGEGEGPFRDYCSEVLGVPAGSSTASPYGEYTADDLVHRLTYVESSRGCAFTCSFCTSANDPGVRNLPLGPFFTEMERLLALGAKKLKFLDRSFNIHPSRTMAVFDFFLDRLEKQNFFVHFEMVPDRFPPEIKDRIRKFPPGSLQLEVGVQTLDPGISRAIHRNLDPELVLSNLGFLARETSATVHADLIAGLPGETLEGFGRGFDRLWEVLGVRPGNEVQLGILKRLPGTPLDAHPEPGAVFRTEAPYDLVSNPQLTPKNLDVLNNMARLWERTVNRGKFGDLTARLTKLSAFKGFYGFAEWYLNRHGKTWGIPEEVLGMELEEYLDLLDGRN